MSQLDPRVLEKRLRPLVDAPADSLVLHEIYASLQGESTHVGRPCVFIRTTACNLRCVWCDTPHAFTQGRPWLLDAIIEEVGRLGPRLVELTGGEPLVQPNSFALMRRLCDAGYEVLLETGGSLDVGAVDRRVKKILDFKAPDSGEEASNRYDNVAHLLPHDEVKLVLASRRDYEWARALLQRLALAERCAVLFGPVFGALPPAALAAWILADRLSVRMQLQLHKLVWDPSTRGV